MTSPRSIRDEITGRGSESLSFSRSVAKSMKSRRKGHKNESFDDDDESETTSVALRCLNLYGRAGGCKVSADMDEDFADPACRRRSSASEDRKVERRGDDGVTFDCFSRGRFFRRSNRKLLVYKGVQQQNSMNARLPDDIIEMCLVRLPLVTLMSARLVCRKWRSLSTTPRFMKLRRDGLFQSSWLFLFGAVKDEYCSGEIHVLDVSLNQWHKIESPALKGRFLFSVAGMNDDVFVVGGYSSLTNFGRLDRSSFKTHKGVLVFNLLTKSWRKVATMKYARSSPVLGVSGVNQDFFVVKNLQNRSERRFYRTRLGGVSDVYEDPHRLSSRRQSLDENELTLFQTTKSVTRKCKKFVLIAAGGRGSWDEPLDSCEIYDPFTNKWAETQRMPPDFGVASTGTVCNGTFYVYSESDSLVGYDIERGYWVTIQTTSSPGRVQEYYPKLVTCAGRVFMVCVSWCEGDGEIGQRNKAVRKVWEFDEMNLRWMEMCTHPDAPMDWNAAFVADGDVVFGVEMFRIFGQVLDFVTMFDASNPESGWSHICRNHDTQNLDVSSCMMKSVAILRL